jgi:hypothetical protein
MQALQAPLPFFSDVDGSPLEAGFLYLGTENGNPETAPATVFWDAAGTQPVAQPVRTLRGYPQRNGTPALIYFAVPVSLTVRNRKGVLILYASSTAPLTIGFINPMTTTGDLIVGGVAGAAGRLAIGANGRVLTVVAGVAAWVQPVVGFANPMTAPGDLIVGQRLEVVAGVPTWVTPPAAAVNVFVGFSARRITTDVSAAGTIIFQDVAFTGGYVDSVSGTPVYAVANGKFTATALDKYDTHAVVVLHNGTGGALTLTLQLKINGSVVLTRDQSVDVGTSSEFSFNQTLALANGDTVEIASPSLGGGVVAKIGASFSMRTATK